ncbi:MAG: hypothetical protein WKF58_02530 [Ilumatobacteraceae bacterium]
MARRDAAQPAGMAADDGATASHGSVASREAVLVRKLLLLVVDARPTDTDIDVPDDERLIGDERLALFCPCCPPRSRRRRDNRIPAALRNAVGWAGNDVERRHLARRMERWQRD